MVINKCNLWKHMVDKLFILIFYNLGSVVESQKLVINIMGTFQEGSYFYRVMEFRGK